MTPENEKLARKGFFAAALAAIVLLSQRALSAATNKINVGQLLGPGASQAGFNLTTTPGGIVGWTPTPAASSINFADYVPVPGTPNGTLTTFTLLNAPSPSTSLGVFKNGQLLQSGTGNDYTVAGSVITFSIAPVATDNLQASYRF